MALDGLDVKKIMDGQYQRLGMITKKAARRMVETLYDANPVDTSKYADNYVSREHWFVTLETYTSTALSGSSAKGYSGDVGGFAFGARADTMFLKNQGIGGLESFNPKKHRAIIIFNPSPYMARLNRGWSPQQTPGWIERCIDAVMSEMGVV